jgi:hypothetical protein
MRGEGKLVELRGFFAELQVPVSAPVSRLEAADDLCGTARFDGVVTGAPDLGFLGLERTLGIGAFQLTADDQRLGAGGG